MIIKDYPYDAAETIEDVKRQISQICHTRKDDIAQAKNLPNVFVAGRKVGRVPSASNDVIAGDKIGDFNVTINYAYYLINDAGTGKWVRAAMGVW